MKKTLLIITTILFGFNVYAGEADIDAGKKSFDAKCASCHGAQGEQPILPVYPKLGGQNAAYFIKQVKAFKKGERKDPTMNAMSMLLQGDEIINIGAYLEMVGKDKK